MIQLNFLKPAKQNNTDAIESSFKSQLESEDVSNDASNSIVKTEVNNLTKPQTQQSSWLTSLEVVGSVAMQAGGAITGAAVSVGGAVGNTAVQAGGAITGAAVSVSGNIGNAAISAINGIGYLFDIASNSPQIREIAKVFQVDWLINVIEKVDIVKAETEVKKLQQKYPDEKPNEIAHRLIVDKAMYAGGMVIASSLLPGVAAAMFAVDLAATTLLQAEMIYQIACAYGLDLKDPARKGEVLTIFGLSLGGGQLLKAGLGILTNIPAAGAVIGLSTNALMLYALGYGACRFYEAKINPLTIEANLIDIQAKSEEYLKKAISQEIIIDQILVHILIAGNPDKTWESIFPELKSFNLSPISLETISNNINLLPSLDTLLDRLDEDFAVVLLSKCQNIARLDGVITAEEAQIIETVRKKFEIN
ncbi:uncharacterized protein associated with GTPases [Pleurocapsa sp. PCC 7327]|uniref:hypothetical protein n=1 Tax=Pleurocapsa sp. PCC 7327 TaxID=118163 RepID=UPI00029FDB40|nr:hypothetical protein [Pleurocapsa sp. PCC 7327]AFY78250.1 uncharacterized protein associated with GTPases [Pleurocapsa sp. PCC 7327]